MSDLSWFLINSILMFLIVGARYVVVAGLFYWLCWKRNRISWQHKRINPKFPDPRIIRAEIRWSMITSLIFGVSGALLIFLWQKGYTRIYMNVSEFGWPYLVLSILLLAGVHETYFYWTHRLMHHPKLYLKIHRVHHDSKNPSPWAAFSFHPSEAVLEAFILPALVLIIPVHWLAFGVFLSAMTVLGVINHLGYELYPAGFNRHRLFRWMISATHHQMHHSRYTCNFGLYFTFWDRLLGTHHPAYEKEFDEIKGRASDEKLTVAS